MNIQTIAAVRTETEVVVEPPYTVDHEGRELHVPWYVTFDRYTHSSLKLPVETRAKLEEIRDAITAALDAAPDAP